MPRITWFSLAGAVVLPALLAFPGGPATGQVRTDPPPAAQVFAPEVVDRLRTLITGGSATDTATQESTPRTTYPTRVTYPDGRSEPVAIVVPTAGVNAAQARASLRATITDPTGLNIYYSDMGTPSQIEAVDLAPKTASRIRQMQTRASLAKSFLSTNRTVLRLDNPDDELALSAENVDALGNTRLRFQQTWAGLPVFAQEASVYVDRDGRITRMAGRYRPTPTLPAVTPQLDLAAAQAAATREADEPLDFRAGELVILPDDDSNAMALAWHVVGYAGATRGWHFFIDANSGVLLRQYSAVHSDGKVAASGKALAGNVVNFWAWQEGNTTKLIDVTRPGGGKGVPNPDQGNVQGYGFCEDIRCAAPLVPRQILTARGTSVPWDTGGISAYAGVVATLDYFQATHDRSGIDGKSGTVNFLVNLPEGGGGYDCNAFWNDELRMMLFGMGRPGIPGCANMAGSLNVIAHELTHGVTSATANLVYAGQSGALNESFSDVFGAMVERTDWLIGKSLFNGYAYLRNMADPHLGYPSSCNLDGRTKPWVQPRHMSEYVWLPSDKYNDFGGVHCNSGIPNRAAYLIAEGLSAEGLGTSIGRIDTERIYYYALTQLSHSNDQFIDARRHMVKAAALHFGIGSNQETAVAKAFDTVGILDNQPGTDTELLPTDANPINASTRLVYRRAVDGKLVVEAADGSLQGPISAEVAAASRPAVAWDTKEKAAYVFYVNEQTKALRMVSLATGKDELTPVINSRGFAVAPGGKFIAATVSTERDIFLLNMQTGDVRTFRILLPTGDGPPVDVGATPHSLAFDYLGENLVFDFAIPQKQPDGTIADQFSIGTLNILTGEFDTLAVGQAANAHLRNPVFATNNNYVIAFDLVDDAQPSASGVYVINRNTRKLARAPSLDLTGEQRPMLGAPVFNRDDSALYVQTRGDRATGTDCQPCRIGSLAVIKADGSWTPTGQVQPASREVGGYPALLVEGSRSLFGSLRLSSSSLNFDRVAVNASVEQSVTLTNTGSLDITLLGFDFTADDFWTPSNVRLVPRGKSVTIPVIFAPRQAGSRYGKLTIRTDIAFSTSVNLYGTGTGSSSGVREPVANVLLPARGDCAKDFYTAEATLAPGAAAGAWGLEVALTRGARALPGGFNLGGAFGADGQSPGFGAFSLAAAQKVTVTVDAQPLSQPINLVVDLKKDNSIRVAGASGTPSPGTPLKFDADLPAGFYVVQIASAAGSGSGTFQLALATPGAFAGGVNVGGYLTRDAAGNSLTGFGAFCLPEPQAVRFALKGPSQYGAGGAGNLVLTLRDAQQKVIGVFK